MAFRLHQKSMTLNDFERQFTAVSSELCVFWLNGWCYNYAIFAIKLHYTLAICILILTTKLKGNPF